MTSSYVVSPPEYPTVAVSGSDARFPVHRIYCVARNYEDHAREMGSSGREPPFFFMKPADAVLPAPADDAQAVLPLPYASMTENLHYELELVAALGRGGRDIPVELALEYVWGYAVGLDMTRRDLQAALKRQGRPWDIAKGFDASAPIGPLTSAQQAAGMADAAMELRVNGEVRQASRTGAMIWKLAEVIAELSRGWALAPGDLIFTGTPAGVGPVQPGDDLWAHVDGLDDLRVRLLAA